MTDKTPKKSTSLLLAIAGAIVSASAYFLGSQGVAVDCPDPSTVKAPVEAPADAGVEQE